MKRFVVRTALISPVEYVSAFWRASVSLTQLRPDWIGPECDMKLGESMPMAKQIQLCFRFFYQDEIGILRGGQACGSIYDQ